MNVIDKALEPFILHGRGTTEYPADGIEAVSDTLTRIQIVRDKLLAYELGDKATRCIGPVLDDIERDIRVSRLLPPQSQNGWAWSWAYDDWFRWEISEKKWVSAAKGWRLDSWM